MIRINLLRDRRAPTGSVEPTAEESSFAPVGETQPSMGVGFDDYARDDDVYITTGRRLNPFHLSLIIAGVVLVGLVIWSVIAGGTVDTARAERDRLESAVAQARADATDLEHLLAQHETLGRRLEALRTMSRPGGSAERYLRLLQAVNLATPQRDIWLSELRERNGSVQLKGNTFNHFALADILQGLIEDPALSEVHQGGAQSVDLDGSRVLQFDFSARLD